MAAAAGALAAPPHWTFPISHLHPTCHSQDKPSSAAALPGLPCAPGPAGHSPASTAPHSTAKPLPGPGSTRAPLSCIHPLLFPLQSFLLPSLHKLGALTVPRGPHTAEPKPWPQQVPRPCEEGRAAGKGRGGQQRQTRLGGRELWQARCPCAEGSQYCAKSISEEVQT